MKLTALNQIDVGYKARCGASCVIKKANAPLKSWYLILNAEMPELNSIAFEVGLQSYETFWIGIIHIHIISALQDLYPI
jgi:hypothetical protein